MNSKHSAFRTVAVMALSTACVAISTSAHAGLLGGGMHGGGLGLGGMGSAGQQEKKGAGGVVSRSCHGGRGECFVGATG